MTHARGNGDWPGPKAEARPPPLRQIIFHNGSHEDSTMGSSRTFWVGMAVAASVVVAGCSSTASTTTAGSAKEASGFGSLSPEAKRDIAEGYRDTLSRLYDTTPGSRELVSKAAGVLVFPTAISAGLVVGGEFGNGELRISDRFAGYYRTTTGSLGLQIGAQSRALVFLFMTQDSLGKFRNSKGWSVGADASVAALKVGANGAVDVSVARAPTIAFVMTNAGLMANLSLEGTKVTPVE